MAELLAKWLMRRYLVLWKRFGDLKFSFQNAQETLDEDSRIVNLLLSELNKAGWIKSIEPHPDDPRKRMYQLKDLENVGNEIAKQEMRIKA